VLVCENLSESVFSAQYQIIFLRNFDVLHSLSCGDIVLSSDKGVKVLEFSETPLTAQQTAYSYYVGAIL